MIQAKMNNKRIPVFAILLLILPTCLVMIIVIILMYWRVPTRIQAELIVEQMVFTIGDETSIPIIKSVGFQSITIEKFAQVTFSPEKLEVADPTQNNQRKDVNQELDWKLLDVKKLPVQITPRKDEESQRLQSAVTFENFTSKANILGSLQEVEVKSDSEVLLRIRGKPTDITISINAQESTANLFIQDSFQIITDFCKIDNISDLLYNADSLTYRAKLSERSSFIEILSHTDLVLSLTISSENTSEIFYTGSIPVKTIESGSVPLLVRYGKITYPEYPKIEGVVLGDSDFINLDQLKKFSIEKIAIDQEKGGIQFYLNGIASILKTGSPDFLKDRRLTRFDILWQNPLSMGLLGLIIWLLPTMTGGYKLFQETLTPFKEEIAVFQRDFNDRFTEFQKNSKEQIDKFQRETKFTLQETITPLKEQIAELQREMQSVFNFIELFPRKNPYVAGSPIIDKEKFFGRSEIIRKITHGIHNNHYYILGGRRSGKTSLLKRLAEEVENLPHPDYSFQPIFVDFQTFSEDSFFKTLCQELLKSANKLITRFDLNEISEKIGTRFGSQAETAEGADDFVDLLFQLYDMITPKLPKSIIFVLIMDEFDKINGFEVALKEEFRSIFMQCETVEHIKMIAAGGKLDEWDRSSPFNFLIEIPLSYLSAKAARQLIITPSRGVVLWEDSVIDSIVKSTERKPYEIQKRCSDIVDYALKNKIFKITDVVLKDFLAQRQEVTDEST